MSARRAIVHPPPETGGRPVRTDDRSSRTAYTLHGLTHSGLVGWHEGEPEVGTP
ncbi:hypothetical protein [Streptomyces sp. NPDC005303]|uniref:hypothetical protein n=1 Tax=Streptomyces sp. NPDC005303 TaxID=3155713 RepID=UPI0033B6CB20